MDPDNLDVIELIDKSEIPAGAFIYPMKMVLKKNFVNDLSQIIEKFKARLTLRGDLVIRPFRRTYSPTASDRPLKLFTQIIFIYGFMQIWVWYFKLDFLVFQNGL